eukprot:CAMPEP_0206512744 /NCGR_PEP_ID=MMETSP0324_2-20121206/61086_1 /ASSEMBLY_ACC=CAM_ASM_000836 /TAXON_ID=2866 /ORGANISM="Crypthecodinium cohnii, Strain Seligo" /LENGTH=36 /DNA_ID= /DNA_START= /DNA_END= /DNA_ORIENTATION=
MTAADCVGGIVMMPRKVPDVLSNLEVVGVGGVQVHS